MSVSVLGELIEMGDLQDEEGSPGFVLLIPTESGDPRFVTVKGLTRSEVRAIADKFRLFSHYQLELVP